jgi:hypothetical protein
MLDFILIISLIVVMAAFIEWITALVVLGGAGIMALMFLTGNASPQAYEYLKIGSALGLVLLICLTPVFLVRLIYLVWTKGVGKELSDFERRLGKLLGFRNQPTRSNTLSPRTNPGRSASQKG